MSCFSSGVLTWLAAAINEGRSYNRPSQSSHDMKLIYSKIALCKAHLRLFSVVGIYIYMAIKQ